MTIISPIASGLSACSALPDPLGSSTSFDALDSSVLHATHRTPSLLDASDALLERWLVVFDLDGTLVDSAPGICQALNRALGLVTQILGLSTSSWRALSASEVGPPLGLMIQSSLGVHWTRERGHQVAQAFMDSYDPVAHYALDYSGADTCLRGLHAAGAALGLATHKRQVAASSISEARGWSCLFGPLIYGFARYPVAGSKASALIHFDHHHHRSLRAMIGDSESDLTAAQEAGFDLFIHASWGCATGWTPTPTFIIPERSSALSASLHAPLTWPTSTLINLSMLVGSVTPVDSSVTDPSVTDPSVITTVIIIASTLADIQPILIGFAATRDRTEHVGVE